MAVTVKQAREAIKAKDGNLAEAARALNISRTALYKKIDAYPELREVVTDAREELKDIAQSVLRKKLNEDDITAAIFVLKSLGKNEGWSERLEVTGNNGGPLTWQRVVAEARKDIDSSDPYA